MAKKLLHFLSKESAHLAQAGLLKEELPISTPQKLNISVGKRKLINLASSDYLGLSNHSALREAAIEAIKFYGVGMAAPRMMTGTRPIHTDLERVVSEFLEAEDTLLFASGYHANTGLFESLLGDQDSIFCDDLIHPSLADGIRLCGARVFPYRNNDMEHLEEHLKRSRGARFRAVVTDGVFALSGAAADLPGICDLAERYDALVVVHDAEGIGVLGAQGQGTAKLLGVQQRVHVITGTFGRSLGAGTGGFIAGRQDLIAWLRQKSRPYLMANAPPPSSTAAAQRALEILQRDTTLVVQLQSNVAKFREKLIHKGFKLHEGQHPIVAVMVGDAVVAQRMVDKLYHDDVFAVGFCHPVVPEGQARIRAQICSEHTEETLDKAVRSFVKAGQVLKVI
ncbi:MAG: glycine C-acetyltransferase [Myxococcota bacterium]